MDAIEKVKLVLSDMDGTLLNSKGELPDGIFDLIRELHQNGVVFGIASGRAISALTDFFAPAKDEMLFMAESGGCILDRGRLLHLSAFDPEVCQDLLAQCRTLPGIYLIFSCFKTAYLPASYPKEVIDTVARFYTNITLIEDLSQVTDPVCKITICDLAGAESYAYPLLASKNLPCKAVLSGSIWIDLLPQTTGKGAALDIIQKRGPYLPSETMVFGDYLNDLDMMSYAGYSCAMANAHPDLKAVCRYEVPSNDEGGVVLTLRKLLEAKRGQS